jgi:hypothetical protein
MVTIQERRFPLLVNVIQKDVYRKKICMKTKKGMIGGEDELASTVVGRR